MSRLAVLAAAAALLSCSESTRSSASSADFVVSVAGETFVLRSTDPQTIRLALENLAGRNTLFPLGPLREGSGGFNAPWTWHLDPAATRMVEAAIELCDGRPSYVEAHKADYPTYCPWGARVVARR